MTYNADGQLASLGFGNPSGQSASSYAAVGAPSGGIQYNFSANQNNGQITQAVDTLSGETISYQYDLLKRLIFANSSASWSQSFFYDGFGNLTAKQLNGTYTPMPVISTTNRLSNASRI